MKGNKHIIEFFSTTDKQHWIDEIRKSDWRAAAFLVELITENKIEEMLGADTKLYILADGEKAAAFVTLSEKDCLDDPMLTPWIGFVYTYPEYRGNRYSGLLIEHAVKEAKKCGKDKIYICTGEVGLYEKYGFEYIENRVDVWGEDSRLYVKNINKDITNGIKQEEIDFPKRFASYEEKEYGILFYMADNKDSYDGNHACIYPDRITDLGAVLDDITEFYNKLGIKVSIYHPFEKDYFSKNLETLKTHGYTYTAEDDHRVMLLTAENSIVAPKRLDIRVLNEWDERIATDILIPSGETWEIEVTKKRTKQDGTYLFVGYLDGKAVVYSDIHKSEHGNTRFDYIVTAKEHRGNGYASELLSFMVEYCKENEFPMCWQWAGPSEHICYKAGFREAFTIEAGFASKT